MVIVDSFNALNCYTEDVNQDFDSFGKKLTALRHQKGMTQEELSEKADISRNFLALLETGKRQPSFRTATQLGKALKIPLNDFLNEEKIEDRQAALRKIDQLLALVKMEDLKHIESVLRALIEVLHEKEE